MGRFSDVPVGVRQVPHIQVLEQRTVEIISFGMNDDVHLFFPEEDLLLPDFAGAAAFERDQPLASRLRIALEDLRRSPGGKRAPCKESTIWRLFS